MPQFLNVKLSHVLVDGGGVKAALDHSPEIKVDVCIREDVLASLCSQKRDRVLIW